jgi:hypothetical protein
MKKIRQASAEVISNNDPRPIDEQVKSCGFCEGTGLLGFQRESCWFCDGDGYICIPTSTKLNGGVME